MNFVGFDFHGKVAFKKMPVRREIQLSSRRHRPSVFFKEQCVELLKRDFFPTEEKFDELVLKGDFEEVYNAFCVDFFFSDETWVYHVTVRPSKRMFRPSEETYEVTLLKVIRFGVHIERFAVLANLSEFRFKRLMPMSEDKIFSRIFEMKRLRAFLSKVSDSPSAVSLIFDPFKNNPFSKNTDEILKVVPQMLAKL